MTNSFPLCIKGYLKGKKKLFSFLMVAIKCRRSSVHLYIQIIYIYSIYNTHVTKLTAGGSHTAGPNPQQSGQVAAHLALCQPVASPRNHWLLLLLCFLLQSYKRKTEAAKKEYLKALAAYRASLVSKVTAGVMSLIYMGQE